MNIKLDIENNAPFLNKVSQNDRIPSIILPSARDNKYEFMSSDNPNPAHNNITNDQIAEFSDSFDLTDGTLKKLFNSSLASELIKLTICRCQNITHNAFIDLTLLKSLQIIILINLPNLQNQFFQCLSSISSPLNSLKISKCDGINDEFVLGLATLKNLNLLKKLKLTRLYFITSSAIEKLVNSDICNNIEKISLKKCTGLDNQAIISLTKSKQLNKLQSLDISKIYKITNSGLSELFKSNLAQRLITLKLLGINTSKSVDLTMIEPNVLCNLTKLQVSNTSDISKFLESTNATKLKTIEFCLSQKNIRQSGLLKYHMIHSQFRALFTNSPTLLFLKEFSSNLWEKLEVLTIFGLTNPDAIDMILKNLVLNNLIIFELIKMKELNDHDQISKSFSNFFEFCELNKLKMIRLVDCDCDGKFLSRIARASILGMDTLILKNLPHISSIGLKNLLLSPVCSNLRILKLNNLPINDEVFTYLAYSTDMENLCHLSIKQTPITHITVEEILKSSILYNLKTISLTKNRQLDDKVADKIGEIYRLGLQKLKIDLNNKISLNGYKKLSKIPYIVIKSSNFIINNDSMQKYQDYSENEWKDILEIMPLKMNTKSFNMLSFNDTLDRVVPSIVSKIISHSCSANINTLELCFIEENPDMIFKTLIESPTLPSVLSRLKLDDLKPNQDDTILMNFITKFKCITSFEIKNCPEFSDSLLKSISMHWEKLEYLKLSHLQNLTIQGFKNFCDSISINQLKHLTFVKIANFDDNWIECLANSQNFSKLQTLTISECENLRVALKFLFGSKSLINIRNISINTFITCYPGNLSAICGCQFRFLNLLVLKLENLNEKMMYELADSPPTNSKKLLLKSLFDLTDNAYAINDATFKRLMDKDHIQECSTLLTKYHTEKLGVASAVELFKKSSHPEFNLDLLNFIEKWDTRINDTLFEQMSSNPIVKAFLLNYGLSKLKRITSKSYMKLVSSIMTSHELQIFLIKNKDGIDDECIEQIATVYPQLFCELPLQQISSFTRLSPWGKRWFLITKHENATFDEYIKLYGCNQEQLDACILEKAFESPIFEKIEKFHPSTFSRFDGALFEKFFTSGFVCNIKELEISGALVNQRFFTELSTQTSLKQLMKITISKPSDKTVEAIGNFLISKPFTKIQDLTLRECEIPTSFFKIFGVISDTLSLKKLGFVNCILQADDNIFLLINAKSLFCLKELIISNVCDRKNRLPIAFFRDLDFADFNLQKLKLVGAKNIRFNSNECFSSWITNTPSTLTSLKDFSELDLQDLDMTDDTLSQFGSWLLIQNLKVLKLKNMDFITFNGFKNLINNPNIQGLTELVISHSKFDNEWSRVLANTLTLKNLKILKIQKFMKNVDPTEGILSILNSQILQFNLNFEEFLTNHASNLNDDILANLAASNLVNQVIRSFKFTNSKITNKGLINFLNILLTRGNFSLDLEKFFYDNVNNLIVNDDIYIMISGHKFIHKYKDDKSIKSFSVANSKSILTEILDEFRAEQYAHTNHHIDKEAELKLSEFFKKYAQDIDDDIIRILSKNADVINTQIRLKSSVHIKVTTIGLNMLVDNFCKKFTMSFDWILLDRHWRNMLDANSLKLISEGDADAFDYLDDLDLSDNNLITTNGYQHLMDQDIKKFQEYHDIEHLDPYLYEDSNRFLNELIQDRFDILRVKIDDEVGEAILKIIKKARFLKRISLNNKNFGDQFCRKLSLIIDDIGRSRGRFLKYIELKDNPRITSIGRKYLYAALVGNDTIVLLDTKCNPSLEYEFNTVLNYGLHYAIKHKYEEYFSRYRARKNSRGKSYAKKINLYDNFCIPMMLYSIACFPFALMQCFEDKFMKSCLVRNINKCLDYTIHGGSNEEKNGSKDKAQRSQFKFNINCIILNRKLNSAKFWLGFVIHFFLYYAACIALPIIFRGSCGEGHMVLGYICYGIYALLVLIWETWFYLFIRRTLDPTTFSIFETLPLIISQLHKFDLYTDILFITSSYECGYTSYANAAAIMLVINTLFSVMQTLSLFVGPILYYAIDKSRAYTNTTFINLYTRLAYSMEFYSIAVYLEEYSSSTAGKIAGVFVPQMIISTLSKLILEDLPQSIIQVTLTVVKSPNNDKVVILSLASTIAALFISINGALRARPSVCDSTMLTELAKQVEKRTENTKIINKTLEALERSKITPYGKNLANKLNLKIASRKLFDSYKQAHFGFVMEALIPGLKSRKYTLIEQQDANA